jgi:uncharacterized membrane protein YkoI
MAILVTALWGCPAFAMFESNGELVTAARLTLDEAVKIAVMAIPGRAVEAQIEKEDGKIVYQVDILDVNNKTHTVYVDAITGRLVKVEN